MVLTSYVDGLVKVKLESLSVKKSVKVTLQGGKQMRLDNLVVRII